MTLPSSGAISISQIANELGVATNTPLRNLSNLAGFSAPDAFSDFYGYSHRSMTINYTYNWDVFSQAGNNTTRYSWEIIGTEAWYVIVDDSEIPFLTFNPMSDADGYVATSHFATSVGANFAGYERYGSATLYWTSDDNFAGDIYCYQEY